MIIERTATMLRRKRAIAALLILACASSACTPREEVAAAPEPATASASTPAAAPPQPAPAPSPPEGQAAPSIDGIIAGARSYSELVDVMKRNGWAPVVDRQQCLAGVVGANHDELCSKHPELETCAVCEQVQGLRNCTADGFCEIRFAHAPDNRMVDIGMRGDVLAWAETGENVPFFVDGWRDANSEDK